MQLMVLLPLLLLMLLLRPMQLVAAAPGKPIYPHLDETWRHAEAEVDALAQFARLQRLEFRVYGLWFRV